MERFECNSCVEGKALKMRDGCLEVEEGWHYMLVDVVHAGRVGWGVEAGQRVGARNEHMVCGAGVAESPRNGVGLRWFARKRSEACVCGTMQ